MIKTISATRIGWLVAALILLASACGDASTAQTTQAGGLFLAQTGDGRPLEEKVDTDGDGEMSEEEIQVYATATLLEFSQCMRDNGYPDFTDVVLEDFTEGGGGQGRFLALMTERGVNLTDPDAIPTLQSCGEGLADLQTFAPQPSDAELQEQEALVLEFAACMREGGLENWPDPDFAANGGNGYGPELLEEFDIQSPEIQDAIETCQAEAGGVDFDGEEGEDEADDDDTTPDEGQTDEVAGDEPEEPIDRTPLSPVIEGDTSDLNVATVTRADLAQTTTLAGTLSFGDERPFPTNSTGIVTALPTEGDTIEFGEAIFYVDNEPVLLFEGDLPQYRAFNNNMSEGSDIEQLERNLVDLGFAEDFDLTVDDDFTATTRDVIEALQLEFDVEDTGEFRLGSVVFSTSPVRIGAVHVELGQSITPQVNVVSSTGSDQRIILDLDADDRSLVSTGDDVEIELPDGTVVAGEVTDVAAVATRNVNPQTGESGDATIEVTVGFSDGPPDNVFDAAPVDIIVTESVSTGVLTVPVPALIALSGGGHAVELIVDGGTQLIGVELGDFVDDIVEVSGDIQEGDLVVMATAG